MGMQTKVYDETLGDGLFFRSGSIGDRCKEQVVLLQDAAKYESGTVLKAGTGDTFVRFDGTGDAAGILLLSVDASVENERGTMIVRDATYVDEALVFAAGVTDAQKKAAADTMEAKGLVGRHYAENTTPMGGA